MTPANNTPQEGHPARPDLAMRPPPLYAPGEAPSAPATMTVKQALTLITALGALGGTAYGVDRSGAADVARANQQQIEFLQAADERQEKRFDELSALVREQHEDTRDRLGELKVELTAHASKRHR